VVAAAATERGTSAPPSPLMRNVKDILAGTCGGIAVTLVGHPFDTVKVLLQTQPQSNPVYTGVVDCATKTIKSDGLLGLYRGVASPLAGQMAFRATLFLSYGACKDLVGANPKEPFSYAKAGALAWATASLAEGPIDFYKSQMQKELVASKINPNHVPEHRSIVSVVKKSVELNGIRGPFQGFSATVMRNIPAAMLYFGTFENLKIYFMNKSGKAPSGAETFASAGTAGFMYWVVFYPTDVVKVSAIPVATYNHLLHLYAGGVVNSRLISSKNQIWCLIIEPCPKHFSRTTPLEDQGHLLHDFALLSKQEEFEFP